jgi:hypothetical protein
MITQEILDTFINKTLNGKFEVSNPTDFDQIIGYFDNKVEAENALKEYIIREEIVFE